MGLLSTASLLLVGALPVSVRVEGAGLAECVSPKAVAQALSTRGLGHPERIARLTPLADGRLRISLEGAQQRALASRVLSVERAQCAALEQTVALLLQAWWRLPDPPPLALGNTAVDPRPATDGAGGRQESTHPSEGGPPTERAGAAVVHLDASASKRAGAAQPVGSPPHEPPSQRAGSGGASQAARSELPAAAGERSGAAARSVVAAAGLEQGGSGPRGGSPEARSESEVADAAGAATATSRSNRRAFPAGSAGQRAGAKSGSFAARAGSEASRGEDGPVAVRAGSEASRGEAASVAGRAGSDAPLGQAGSAPERLGGEPASVAERKGSEASRGETVAVPERAGGQAASDAERMESDAARDEATSATGRAGSEAARDEATSATGRARSEASRGEAASVAGSAGGQAGSVAERMGSDAGRGEAVGATGERAPSADRDAAPGRFTVAAALRAQASFDGAFTAAGQLAVDLGQRRGFGAWLDGGVASPRTAALGPGTVTARAFFASALARYAVRGERLSLHGGLGVRLFFLAAASAGFTSDASATVVSPAVCAQLEGRLSLWRGLFATAQLALTARLREERLSVPGLGTGLAVTPWGLALGLGLGFEVPSP